MKKATYNLLIILAVVEVVLGIVLIVLHRYPNDYITAVNNFVVASIFLMLRAAYQSRDWYWDISKECIADVADIAQDNRRLKNENRELKEKIKNYERTDIE